MGINKSTEDFMYYLKETIKLPIEEEINKYISAFSFYLYNSDPNYTYNVSFLCEKHISFLESIREAKCQYGIFYSIVDELKNNNELQESLIKFRVNESSDDLNVVLSMNSFLRFDMLKNSEIELCEPLRLPQKGRCCKSHKYTFCYGNITKYFAPEENKQAEVINIILKTIKLPEEYEVCYENEYKRTHAKQ